MAGGVRFGNDGFGITLQQKMLEHSTIEAIATGNLKEVSLSGLIEHHNNILFGKSLNSYAGIGPSVGKYYGVDSMYIGCNIVLGIEYKVLLLPIVVSIDLKPTFRLQETDWYHTGIGISFRYIFIRERTHLFNKS